LCTRRNNPTEENYNALGCFLLITAAGAVGDAAGTQKYLPQADERLYQISYSGARARANDGHGSLLHLFSSARAPFDARSPDESDIMTACLSRCINTTTTEIMYIIIYYDTVGFYPTNREKIV